MERHKGRCSKGLSRTLPGEMNFLFKMVVYYGDQELSSQLKILDELHDGHPGISRMKSLARSEVWWPKIDADLEQKVKECEKCQVNRKTLLHPWKWPKLPWARIHIDHAGPFQRKLFLLVVDAH